MRMTFTFREQDVPADRRMPDHRGGGRAGTPGKTGEARPPRITFRLLELCQALLENVRHKLWGSDSPRSTGCMKFRIALQQPVMGCLTTAGAA